MVASVVQERIDYMEIPFWEKFLLTPKEASEYSNIGVDKIMELLKEPQCNFVIRKGTHFLIKRTLFEKFLENISVI